MEYNKLSVIIEHFSYSFVKFFSELSLFIFIDYENKKLLFLLSTLSSKINLIPLLQISATHVCLH